tara:strand:+ start:1263 stop:1769 length:507 start_codon:yes stop_codon:yes gene_type:complete
MRAPLVGTNINATEHGGPSAVRVGVVDVTQTVALRRGAKRKILDRISFSFDPGTMSAVMGPSGAGKTTLLNTLRSGRCTSGTVTLNGNPFPRRAARQLIKTIPQDDILLPGLSALEMLSFVARLALPRAATNAERAERVASVLRMLHLTDADAHTRIGSVRRCLTAFP